MDISMDISMDLSMDIHIHGKPAHDEIVAGVQVGHSSDFRPIYRHISKTVHFRHKVTIGQ